MHLQQLVDRFRRGSGAGGDPLLAARFQNVGIAPLLRRHRIDDGDLPFDHVFIDVGSGELIFHFGDAGQHAHEPAEAAHSLHLGKLLAQIAEIERAFAHFLGGAHRLLGIDIGRGFFDQRNDIAHAENAAGNPRRIELLERIQFFAGADELDWFAGDRAHRQCGAATTIAVDARENDAGEAHAFVERARQIDRVLAGERIGNEKHFVRIDRVLDLGRLAHHCVIERGPAGRIEHHHVIGAELCRFEWPAARSAGGTVPPRSAAC